MFDLVLVVAKYFNCISVKPVVSPIREQAEDLSTNERPPLEMFSQLKTNLEVSDWPLEKPC